MYPVRVMAVVIGLAAGSAEAGETLNFVERVTNGETLLHRDRNNQDALGDLIVFSNTLYTSDNRQPLGTDQGYCVRVVVGKSWECFWTVQLADGQIMSHGPFNDTGESSMAVTGGSGKYAGARGVLTVRARSDKTPSYNFRYELL